MSRQIYVAQHTSEFLYQHVKNSYQDAIEKIGRFTVAISGGSLPKVLGQELVLHKDEFDWSKWHVFYADERCVPHDSQDSNHGLVVEHLLKHVSVPSNQVHAIHPDLVDNPEKAAEEYEQQLMSVIGVSTDNNDGIPPSFDLILLGIGPDGHTCSLFPGHSLLQEHTKWVSFLTDSPKPPPSRITLTYPILKYARACTFVCTGSGKAQTLVDILEKGVKLPAALVESSQVNWILDEAAAASLSCSVTKC